MQLEHQFKLMWADHGDMISRQYAGTGALKSGFTRTGKRTLGGLIDDGLKSCVRYYLNNYEDGKKQDAFDLITQGYTPPSVCLLYWSMASDKSCYNKPRHTETSVYQTFFVLRYHLV